MSKIGFEDILFELNLGRRGDVVHQLLDMDAAVVFSPENVAWLADEAISVKGGAVVVVGEFWNFLKFEIFLCRDGLGLERKMQVKEQIYPSKSHVQSTCFNIPVQIAGKLSLGRTVQRINKFSTLRLKNHNLDLSFVVLQYQKITV